MSIVIYILYYLWDLTKIYIFTLSFKFFINKHVKMICLIETCSVWDNNNKYSICQMEYVVLFM
jgi:hypothetical protein